MPQVTKVQVRLVEDGGPVKALVTAVLDGEFAVHGIRVIDGPSGEFVSMPARKAGDGEWRDVFHPVTAEARERLVDAVVRAYVEAAAQAHDTRRAGREHKRRLCLPGSVPRGQSPGLTSRPAGRRKHLGRREARRCPQALSPWPCPLGSEPRPAQQAELDAGLGNDGLTTAEREELRVGAVGLRVAHQTGLRAHRVP